MTFRIHEDVQTNVKSDLKIPRNHIQVPLSSHTEGTRLPKNTFLSIKRAVWNKPTLCESIHIHEECSSTEMLDLSVAIVWYWYSTRNIVIQEVTPYILQLCPRYYRIFKTIRILPHREWMVITCIIYRKN